ncbi:MAG TPA: DnaA/Hda family protein [Gemmatimonadales bacterium]|nr:DnaA/Hda family protein [Gemmatimonadales bacterium]
MTATLNPLYRFDTLVVGAANRLAFTAAKAVAESPGTVYNPLFIYARPGLGKTHLLMGIGHAARAINPGLSVEYLTLDEFVESFHAAVAAGQGEAYRRRFIDVDLLLVDDVQFLTHRREMQAELLRLTDALQTNNRQIVLTSDRPPSEIEALDERLIRRFAGGLVIDIGAPDYETRVAILRRKAEERRARFGEGVLEAVGSLVIDNVRELLGALNRLVAFQAVSDAPLQPAQAKALATGTDVTVATEKVEKTLAPPAPTPARTGTVDEFSDFLTEVSATVAQQVDSWRTKVAAAILRWEGEGFSTARLEALLQQEMTTDPEQALHQFESDVRKLQALHAEAAELAPSLAGSSAFRDPDDLTGAEAVTQRAREGAHPPPAPLPIWRLDDLFEAAGNRMALQAARAIVAEPAQRYNPLVIVGASGVGKTHLLHALGNALAARVKAPVACLSAHEFTGELIEAIDRDAVGAWRARYRGSAAFLLDDVHLVADKDRTQDELFVLFNFLMEAGRQMVFTSAVPLAELTAVESRLRTRLEGGLVVDLPAPEREIRQQVVERLLQAKVGTVDPDLAGYLGSRTVESVRAVHGLLQRVLNAAESQGNPPSASLAREVLEGSPPKPVRRPASSRSSGIVAPAGGVRSREKMVWDWPDAGDRIVEEWR